MHADVRHRGVKKFSDLVLVHPDHAVSGIQGDRGIAVNRVVDDNVLFVAAHFASLSKIFIIHHCSFPLHYLFCS